MNASPTSDKTRVVWVNRFFHPDESATSIMLSDLVRGLSERSAWQHVVVTSSASYASHADAAAQLPGVVVHRLWALAGGQASLARRMVNFMLFYVGALVTLLRCVRRGDVVVVLTDPPLIGLVGMVVARVKGARTVNWVQDIFPETAARLGYVREGGLIERLLMWLRDASWQRAHANVVIGERMRAHLETHHAPPAAIRVIQNWSDDSALEPVERAHNALRREWQFSPATCVVGYSGNLGRAHDIDTMAEAMRLLDARGGHSVRFVFIGGGAKHDSLRRTVQALTPGMVEFRSYQPMDRLAQSLSVPDIHWISLQPELEGLIVPSKLYGILAVARPIVFVGDPQGEIARILAEAECGLTFAPGQGAALAEGIASLAADQARLRKMGENGRAYLDSCLRRAQRIDQWNGVLAQQTADRT